MTPRQTMIEAMASAMSVAAGRNPDRQLFYTGREEWTLFAPHAIAALDALLATLPTLGLAVVPAEPTEGMLQAASAADEHCNVHNYVANAPADEHWDVMLAAAPNPLAGDE